MSVDRDMLARSAAETGFPPDTLEKVIRLGEILFDVQSHPFLSRALVLKGGTALNLGFGTPPRLSVDLDFNYVGAADREAMLSARPGIERAVRTIATARGYSVQTSADSHAGRKVYLLYRNASGGPDRLEVDLNYIHRLPLLAPEIRSLWQPPGKPAVEAWVLAPEELIAGKLCALFDRRLPRDLFDVLRIPHLLGDAWLEGRTRLIFVALAGTTARPYYLHAEKRLKEGTRGDVEKELRPLVRSTEPLEAGELRARAWAIVEPLTRPTDAEREYTERLQSGELLPELIFPDDTAMADRVRNHPALLWKAQHASAHARRSDGRRGPTPEGA